MVTNGLCEGYITLTLNGAYVFCFLKNYTILAGGQPIAFYNSYPMSNSKPFKLEYIIKSSPTILYSFLTTPAGLSQWFADSVDINGEIYTFVWNGVAEEAELLEDIENELVRFRWEYADEHEYFEFSIELSEVTGDTILYITDFAEEADRRDQEILWDSQIANLIKRLGGS